MKQLFILVIFLFTASGIFAQDLIVTSEGDSINCYIARVKKDNIYFTFSYKGEIRNTLLPYTSVKEYQFGYYQHSEVPGDKVTVYGNYQHIRLALNGGYAYRTARIGESVPADFKDYFKGLKSGYHVGADLCYYITEPLGIGFKYYFFNASNSLESIYREDLEGNRTYGSMSDDISISYIGPVFSTRFLSHDESKALILNVSLGYMGYSDDKVLIENYWINGSTLGMAYDIAYDFAIGENLFLGFQISLLSGILFNYDVNDGTMIETIVLKQGEYENLNRIDLSIGLRFGK